MTQLDLLIFITLFGCGIHNIPLDGNRVALEVNQATEMSEKVEPQNHSGATRTSHEQEDDSIRNQPPLTFSADTGCSLRHSPD